MNAARLWHPWLRINRVLRVMLHTHWSAEAWAEVRMEFRRALGLRSQIRGGMVQLTTALRPAPRTVTKLALQHPLDAPRAC
jgi:hypothetical protein